MQQISPRQLAEWLGESALPGVPGPGDLPRSPPVLLDVREPWEYDLCHLPGAKLMSMHTVPLRLDELDPDAPVVLICHHGARSMQVAMFLERNGFASLHNLAGGVDAWARDVDPAMRKY